MTSPTRIRCVVLHPTETLMLVDGNRELPGFTEEQSTAWWESASLNAWAAARLGVPTRVLRCLQGDDNQAAAGERVYVLEALTAVLPAGGCVTWASVDGIAPEALSLAMRTPAQALQAGEPWAYRGWLQDVESFVRRSCGASAVPPVPEWRQLRAWPRSCVYAIGNSGSGSLYFKACPPTYAYEASLTRALASLFPQWLPVTVAVDAARGWLLTSGFDGRELSLAAMGTGASALGDAVVALATIQRDAVARVPALVAAGCPRLDLPALATAIEALAADAPCLMVDAPGGLTPAELAAFRAALPRLVAACSRLAAHGVPSSVEHGDFRAANVLVSEGGDIRLIDWGNAQITHPYVSLAQLLDEEAFVGSASAVRDTRDRLLAMYLATWSGRAPASRDFDAFTTARVLAPLVRAVDRRERLLPSLEDPRQWAFSVAYWVRRSLEAMTGAGGQAAR